MQKNIGEYLLERVMHTPRKVALVDDDHEFSYLELFRRSVFLSNQLKITGVKKNIPVIVFVPKSCEAVISIVAISFARGVYVPVDVTSPLERLRSVYSQLGDAYVVCTEATLTKAKQLVVDEARIICLPEHFPEAATEKNTDLLVTNVLEGLKDVIDQDPCYIIFTSGSTGVPKGVTIAHRSVIDYIEWAKSEYPINENHRIASQAPFYFDNSTLDLYLAFSTGATLYIPKEKIYAFPKLIIDYIFKNNITTIFWVPSVLVAIANSGLLEKSAPKSLEHVLFAGEQMPVPQINKWVNAIPGALFSNLYGPTEITVDCTAYTFYEPYQEDILPIGYACNNTEIFIINDFGKESEVNEVGEIYVRGSSLSLGYWNDPVKTDAVFIQNPLESRFRDLVYRTGDLAKKDEFGCIKFLGRKDSQIKLNGYRIELGEIEAAVSKVADIARSAAVFDSNRKKIVLYVQMMQGMTFDLLKLRTELSQLVPKYMLPAEIIVVSSFELNQNGKIDRLKLAMSLEENL